MRDFCSAGSRTISMSCTPKSEALSLAREPATALAVPEVSALPVW